MTCSRNGDPDFLKQNLDVDLKVAMLGGVLEVETAYGFQELSISPKDPLNPLNNCLNHGDTFVLTPPSGSSQPECFRGSYKEYLKMKRGFNTRFKNSHRAKSGENKIPTLVTINLKIPEEIDDELMEALRTTIRLE